MEGALDVDFDMEMDPELRRALEESLRTYQMVGVESVWDVGIGAERAEREIGADSGGFGDDVPGLRRREDGRELHAGGRSGERRRGVVE